MEEAEAFSRKIVDTKIPWKFWRKITESIGVSEVPPRQSAKRSYVEKPRGSFRSWDKLLSNSLRCGRQVLGCSNVCQLGVIFAWTSMTQTLLWICKLKHTNLKIEICWRLRKHFDLSCSHEYGFGWIQSLDEWIYAISAIRNSMLEWREIISVSLRRCSTDNRLLQWCIACWRSVFRTCTDEPQIFFAWCRREPLERRAARLQT